MVKRPPKEGTIRRVGYEKRRELIGVIGPERAFEIATGSTVKRRANSYRKFLAGWNEAKGGAK